MWVRIRLSWVVIDTTLCDKVYQWLAAGPWFSRGTRVSSTNKTDRYDITEILLKVVLTHHTPCLTHAYAHVHDLTNKCCFFFAFNYLVVFLFVLGSTKEPTTSWSCLILRLETVDLLDFVSPKTVKSIYTWQS